MLTHNQIWTAIDALAESAGLSTSGLAIRAGLDSTSFNQSKRFTSQGRQRWPSTESIAKILSATNTTFDDFTGLVVGNAVRASSNQSADHTHTVPLIGFAQAGTGGFFDDAGFPVGQGWDEIPLPGGVGDGAYALKVSGDSMMPLYRQGDVLVVDPAAVVRSGDRVIVKTSEGEVLAKNLTRKTASMIELNSLNPDHPDLQFKVKDIEWIARIVWASQ